MKVLFIGLIKITPYNTANIKFCNNKNFGVYRGYELLKAKGNICTFAFKCRKIINKMR
ncbi:MAG: hypothetical protein ACI8ZB_002180 [Desulforhopalus sp.]